MICTDDVSAFKDSLSDTNKRGVILAIDYGLKRSGFAISDDRFTVAMPLCAVDTNFIFETLSRVLEERSVIGIIIGLPYTKDGLGLHPISKNILNIANHISKEIKISVLLWDERMSTVGARRAINYFEDQGRIKKDGTKSRKKRKIIKNDDSYAAQYILEGALLAFVS